LIENGIYKNYKDYIIHDIPILTKEKGDIVGFETAYQLMLFEEKIQHERSLRKYNKIKNNSNINIPINY
jgi:hypothetical protein